MCAVSILAFYSNNPSSNPAEVYKFFCKMMFENKESKQKVAGGWPKTNYYVPKNATYFPFSIAAIFENALSFDLQILSYTQRVFFFNIDSMTTASLVISATTTRTTQTMQAFTTLTSIHSVKKSKSNFTGLKMSLFFRESRLWWRKYVSYKQDFI